MNTIESVYLGLAASMARGMESMIKLKPEPRQEYQRAQQRNEERFLTRGRVIWTAWRGQRRVRPEGARKLTKAEKKAIRKSITFQRVTAARVKEGSLSL